MFYTEKRSKIFVSFGVVVLVCVVAMFLNWGDAGTVLTEDETAAILSICRADEMELKNITGDVFTKEITTKFPAVEKVHMFDGTLGKYRQLYIFIVKPIAYNGPVTIVVVIDGERNECVGIRIVEHMETKHYVRDMESAWFIGRFENKAVNEYLQIARLAARNEREIVAITGATVTTEAIVNGVNAAFGAYSEFILKQTCEAVPYMVRFEPGQGNGPEETSSLAVRAYGVVFAQISLEEIKALPSVKRTMSIHSSAGTTQHSFTGTLLSNILAQIDPDFASKYSYALAVGVDDYISDIRMEEIIAENNVFVMYEDGGEPLVRKDGAPGAMRIVVIDDTFGQRFTNFLLEIVLENEAAY